MKPALTALSLLAAAAAASAQGTITYSWDANDSGSSAITIGPGETLSLRMWALMEPFGNGFAGSIYDIVGLEDWDTGTITRYENLLNDLTDNGDLQPNNDILGIESFQLPKLFNPTFRAENPIALYEIEWTPDDYTPRTVRLTDANHLNNDVYTDDFGTSVSYDQAPSEGATIQIVPAPATFALLAAALLAHRRRR